MTTKILIIEDEEPVRANIVELLEAEGFETLATGSGTSGIALAAQQLPDLILCDIMMPATDGYAVLQALRQNSATATIPFIFLTAKSERSDLRQGMNLGADDYLTKPFTADELLTAVATRLKQRAMALQQYAEVKEQAETLNRKAEELQRTVEVKDEIIHKIAQDLRDPLSNINMAVRMLQQASSQAQRDRYIKVLKEECDREIQLLNQVAELQHFLTPDNIKLLQQFNLLKKEEQP